MLERAIGSVLRQTFSKYEIIVVDDGSAAPIPSNVRGMISNAGQVLRLDTSGGPSVARNRGLDAARGEWTIFLDDDDELDSRYLEVLAAKVGTASPGVTCVAASARILTYDGEVVANERISDWASSVSGDGVAREKFLESPETPLIFSGIAIRTAEARAVRFDESIRSAVDREFMLRLFRHGSLLAVPECLVLVHTHNGVKVNVYSEHKARAYVRILEVNSKEFESRPRSRSAFERKTGWLLAMTGCRSEARVYFRRSVRSWPWDGKTWAIAGIYALPGSFATTLHRQLSRVRSSLLR